MELDVSQSSSRLTEEDVLELQCTGRTHSAKIDARRLTVLFDDYLDWSLKVRRLTCDVCAHASAPP